MPIVNLVPETSDDPRVRAVYLGEAHRVPGHG